MDITLGRGHFLSLTTFEVVLYFLKKMRSLQNVQFRRPTKGCLDLFHPRASKLVLSVMKSD